MAAVPSGSAVYLPAQSIMLQAADGLTFPSALPPRLHGLISAAEFGSSMTRCNAAFVRSWQRHAAGLVSLSGFVLWAVMISQAHSGGGQLIKLLMGGFGGFVALMIIGGAWGAYLEKQRQERLRVAVAAENDYYNGQQRAARFGQLRVPVSWTIASGPMQNGQTDRRGRPITVMGIQIDIGGGMVVAAAQPQSQPQPQPQPPPFVAGPPFAQPAAYGAPPPFAGHYAQPPIAQPSYAHPTYASNYAQPAQAPSYAQEGQAPPAYSPHAEISPLSSGEFAQQLQPGQSPAAAYTWAAEGQPFKGHAVASPPLAQQSLPSGAAGAASCERCGRVAPNATDRFCAACGGSIMGGT